MPVERQIDRRFFESKYSLPKCYQNPALVNPMHIHIYEAIKEFTEIMAEVRDNLKEKE